MKKHDFLLLLITFSILIPAGVSAQVAKKSTNPLSVKSKTFFDLRKQFNEKLKAYNADYKGYYTENGIKKKVPGFNRFKRWEWYWHDRTNPVTGDFPKTRAADIIMQIKNSASRSASGNWTSMGPASSSGGYHGIGRINCIGFRENDNNTYYAGSPSGGLWKTTDNAVSWSVLTDDNAVLGVSDVVVLAGSTAANDTLFIATGDRDGGSLWTMNGGQQNDNNSIGILKSVDGGTTWNSTGLTFSASSKITINRLLTNPQNHQILYAATSNGLYKTSDGGTTWTLISSEPFYDMEFKPGDAQTIYAGGQDNGDVFLSTDGGITWNKALSTSGKRVVIAVSPNQNSWVYAAVAVNDGSGLKGFYKSDNSGVSYLSTGCSVNLLGRLCNGLGGGQGNYDFTMAVDPNNANVVFVGGVNTWKTTDGGINWNIKNYWTGTCGGAVQEVHADKHCLTFQNGSSTLFEGNDGGIYKTSDGGTTWSDLSNGIVIGQIYRTDVSQTNQSDVIAGLQDNGTKSVNAGSWQDVIGGDGMDCIIDYSNSDIQFGESQNGGLKRTTNHWATSTDLSSHFAYAPWIMPLAIDPNVHTTIYAVDNTLKKSIDGGNTWTSIGSHQFREFAIAPSNSDYIYGCTGFDSNSELYKTTDGGVTWTNITGTLPVNQANITYVTVKDDDVNTVWITMGQYNSYSVFETTDGGTTWKDISYGLPEVPVMTLAQNKLNTSVAELYAGTDVGVYVKYGNGKWQLFSNGLPNVVITELKIYYDNNTPSNSRIRAASYGRGLWESDLYTFTAGTPQTDFIADDTVPILNQTVNLYDFSGNLPTSWQWTITPSTFNFVDGTNANSQNPKVQFTALGNYTVQLTATNAGGSNTNTKTDYITTGQYHYYCQASGGGTEYISGVEVGNINNTGTGSDGYHDYKSLSTDLYQGEAEVSITVTNGISSQSSDVSAWVDWNRDGIFDETTENIICESDNGATGTYLFDVPSDADTGRTVMRVRIKQSGSSCGEPCGTSYRGEVEDYTIIVTQMPACPPPSHQEESNITATMADLSWSQIGSITSWDVRLVLQGADTTGKPFTTTSSNPLHIDTLSGNTQYDWYIRSHCGSSWIGPSSFLTSCSSNSQPLSENFDGVSAPNLPNCWSKIVNSSNYAYVKTYNNSAVSSPNCVLIYNANDTSGTVMLITPQFTDLTNQTNQIRFYAKGDDPDYSLIIGTMTDPQDASTFTPFKTITLSDTYSQYTVIFGSTYGENNTYIAFKHAMEKYYENYYIDDFVYEATPACPPPSDLSESNITASSATLSWVENGTATSWDIRIVEAGADTNGTSVSTISSNPITVDTLTANTSYDWYVKAHCGNNWSESSGFTTDCNSYSATFSENFDAVTTPELPDCWSDIIYSTSNYARIETYKYSSPHSSPNHILMYNSLDNNATLMLVTPRLSDLTSQTNQIRFYAKSSVDDQQLIIGTMSDPADTATFTEFKTITTGTTYDSLYLIMFGSSYTLNNEYIAFKHGLGNGSVYIYIDDFQYEPMPACPPPSDLTENNITQTSVTLDWTENGSASQWDLRLVLKGTDTTGTGFVTKNVTSIVVDTLDPNTYYDWYVRSNCGSDWKKSSFVTNCTTFSSPFDEYFDIEAAPNLPHCWSSIVDANNSYAVVESYTSQTPVTSPNHIHLYNYSDVNALLLFISPEINDLTTQQNQITFYAKAGSAGDSVIVGTMSDPADQTTFTAFKTIELTNSYEEYLVMFGSSYNLNNNYIAFKAGVGATYRHLYIDNFHYEPMPLYPPPSDLYETNITQNSADLGWTENGTATSWDVRIVLQGADTTAVAYAVTSNNPFTVDTLTSNTYYEWYVREHGGDNWGGPSEFVTDCGTFTVNYSENFDGVTAPEIPHCWNTIVNSTYTGAVVETNTSNEHSYPNHVRMYNGNDLNSTLLLISPAFSDLTSQQNQISFYAKCSSNTGTLIVGTMSDAGDASTFSTFDTIQLSTTYTQYNLFFGAAYTGTNNIIAFKHGNAGSYHRVYIDDFVYEPMPSCPHPSNPTTSNITQTSADLSWLENSTATSWDVRIVLQGTDTTGTPYTTTSSNPLNVDTLTAATTYSWYVRSNCGGAWTSATTFTTDCGTYNASLSENFDAVTKPDLPLCWSSIKESNDYPNYIKVETYSSSGPYSTPNHVLLYNYYDNNAKLYLITPQLGDLTSQQNQIRFYAKGYYNGYTLIVGTMSNPADETTFTPYKTITLTNSYAEYIVYFGGNYTGSDEYIAFKHGLGGTNRYIYIDNFNYEPVSGCPPPLNLTASNVNATTEKLSWTEQGVSNTWDIRIVTNGTDTTGLPYSTVTSKPVTVDTLTASTTYQWYVRAACGSSWSDAGSFTTECPSITTFPFTEGFETSVPPQCWHQTVVAPGNTMPAWSKTASSTYPTAQPAKGSAMAIFNSHYASSGTVARLSTPQFNFTGLTEIGLSFWMYHYKYGDEVEGITVQVSVNGGVWNNIGTIYPRKDNESGWSKHTVNLSSLANTANVSIGFLANSNYQYNLYIDSVTIHTDIPATAIWTGTGGRSWYENGNWNATDIPFDSTDVIIPTGLTNYPEVITYGGVCKNIIIESDDTGDAALLGTEKITVNGTATAERYLTSGKWHEISPMINEATANNFYFNGTPSVWLTQFNEPTNDRTYIIALSTPLNTGRGYEAWVDAGYDTTVTFAGTLIDSSINVSLSFTHDTLGYNLLGNPFTCPVLWGTGTWNLANVDNEVWVWDPVAGNYRSYSGSGSGLLTGGIIPKGQGFFVHTNAANASLTIPTDARTLSDQSFYAPEPNTITHFILTVQKEERFDGIWITFKEGLTNGYDNSYDGRKRMGSNDAPQLYCLEEQEKLSIDALPDLKVGESKVVNLMFKAGKNGTHTMTAQTEDIPGIEVFLEDMQTGTMQLLNKNPQYNFTASSTDEHNRFRLHFTRNASGINENGNEHRNINIYSYGHTIYIASKNKAAYQTKIITVFDLTGKKIKQQKLPAGDLVSLPLHINNQYVAVRIICNSQIYNSKIFLSK
jgi:photosystem II stability/assembly factor-like uncharacterized protein